MRKKKEGRKRDVTSQSEINLGEIWEVALSLLALGAPFPPLRPLAAVLLLHR